MATFTPVPVPAIPPLPPQLSLLSSGINPPNTSESVGDGVIDLTLLPADLAAELELDQTEEWIKGFGYLPRLGAAAVNRSPQDMDTELDPWVPANLSPVLCQPWVAITTFTLTALDWQAEDFVKRAEEQLDAAVPAAIEAEFWTGALAKANGWPNNYLAGANSTDKTPVPGTPVSILQGLGILQTALRTGFGGQGMIHVMPEAVPNLLNSRRVGKYLLDMFDNIIVPGVGYTGTGPTGDAPDAGTTWMYATDLVSCRVQKSCRVFPGSFAEALDRSEGGYPNTITFRAQKFVAATFDGFRQFAVLVSLPS